MKVWLVSVALLFVVAEFLLWAKNFILPLPIYLLGGAFLAIASNYEKGIFALFRSQAEVPFNTLSQTATLIETEPNQISETELTAVTYLPQQQVQPAKPD
ncbi:hypothetical protein Sta7437_0764 [Stanieria cyanosphaera PCC 7437]|uniref:Uncharacterized protein n=1 Tax=Stanieria cyanosphaera (strain ATCC 29371 / PCC 7437) TaxID=111780 RepID=K9XP15_STAC7|nr:hypothetical protein [Stanieria cyanosphaera]AFZ34355.1 hypothetical protein Sta7437_0764 [Stanieria cyanosphaera PCC 7437]